MDAVCDETSKKEPPKPENFNKFPYYIKKKTRNDILLNLIRKGKLTFQELQLTLSSIMSFFFGSFKPTLRKCKCTDGG